MVEKNMPKVIPIDGQAHGPLNAVARHLWTPMISSGRGRVVHGGGTPGWHSLRRYTIQPSGRWPRLLVSEGASRATARALLSYRQLRQARDQMGRLAVAARAANDPWWRAPRITVESTTPDGARVVEPLSRMEEIFEQRLLAVIGIRTSANGKATLQLFTGEGLATGYAKLAWNEYTCLGIQAEAKALRSVGFRDAQIRTPRLLASADLGDGFPFFVTEPLPSTARRMVRSEQLPLPRLLAMFPVVRRAPLSESGQFDSVAGRLGRLGQEWPDSELATISGELLRAVAQTSHSLPVVARWHGDLVPWNAATDEQGHLWLWDWESSEEDAVLGLDLLHWLLNRAGPPPGGALCGSARAAMDEFCLTLRQSDMDDSASRTVAAHYALTFAERNWTLARAQKSWDKHRYGRSETIDLLQWGRSLLDGGRG